MRLLPPIAMAAAGIVLVVACKSDKDTACKVDTDCGQGSFCRDEICAVVGSDDGGTDGSPPVTSCIAPGGACTSDDDCCVRPCNGLRCASGTGSSGRTSSGASGSSGTSGSSGSSGTSCTDLYGLCSTDSDCCTGLSCNDNACR